MLMLSAGRIFPRELHTHAGAVAALGRCRWSAADVGSRVLAAVRLLTLQQVGLWLLR